jgi:transcriptional regulator with XRE-family HTH domain
MPPDETPRLIVAEGVGANLLKLRRREGLSQAEVGRRAGLERSEVAKLESGMRIPRIDTLIRLAGAMAVDVEDLVEGIVWVPAPDRKGVFVFGSGGGHPRGSGPGAPG